MRLTAIAAGLFLVFALPCAFAATGSDLAIEKRPGAAAMAQKVEVVGVIAAIDRTTREVTLSVEGGEPRTIIAGPEVRNFEQLDVGDAVRMEYLRALALELRKGSTAEVYRKDEGTEASAEPGATPAAAAGRRVNVMAEVMAVDAEAQTVTLRGPKQTIDLKVRDQQQFDNIAVGDRIEATYVEAFAIQVTAAEPSR